MVCKGDAAQNRGFRFLAWGATVVCLFHADAYRFCVKDLKAPPPFYYDTIPGTFMISGAFHASDGEVKGVGT